MSSHTTLNTYIPLTDAKNVELDNYLLVGVLARTDIETGLPYFDDLSHHMLMVAAAISNYGDKNLVVSGLIHDFFKGLMIWKKSNGKNWLHLHENRGVMEKFAEKIFRNIDSGIIDIKKVAENIISHHKHRGVSRSEFDRNIIHKVESGKLIRSMELSYMAGVLHDPSGHLTSISFNLSGRYRWLLAYLFQEILTRELTNIYADCFEKLLGIRKIKYVYRPLSVVMSPKNEIGPIIEKFIEEESDRYEIVLDTSNKEMIIPLPVNGLKREFFVEYNDGENIVFDPEKGIHIPFGEALSTFSLGSANLQDGVFLFIKCCSRKIEEIRLFKIFFEYIKKELQDKIIDIKLEDLKASLCGTFENEELCTFCNEPSAYFKDLGNKFTDTPLLLRPITAICPACLIGYMLEEKYRVGMKRKNFMIPQPVIITSLRLLPDTKPILKGCIKDSTYLTSISGLFWQKILSQIWYDLVNSEDGLKYADRLLNPTYLLYPLKIKFIPLSIFLLHFVQRKKFVLESGLDFGLVAMGENHNLDVEEFRALSDAFSKLKDRIDPTALIEYLRAVYGISWRLPRISKKKRKREG